MLYFNDSVNFSDIPLSLHSDALLLCFGLACHIKMNSRTLEMDDRLKLKRGQ